MPESDVVETGAVFPAELINNLSLLSAGTILRLRLYFRPFSSIYYTFRKLYNLLCFNRLHKNTGRFEKKKKKKKKKKKNCICV